MTGKKTHYLCTLLCSILAVSAFISEVSARSLPHRLKKVSKFSKQSPQQRSHTALSGFGGGHPQTNLNPNPNLSGTSRSRIYSPASSYVYPAAHPNSLSGGGSRLSAPSYTQNPSPYSNRIGGYAAAPPNSLSGGGSGSSAHNYPQTNKMSGSGARPGNVPTGTRYTNGGTNYQQNNPSINTQNTSWRSNQPVHHVPTASHIVHQHYYSPPTIIHYSTSYGVSPVSYPIFRGVPPSYVYEYRFSGNKYSYLLAGLALYNLGKISTNPRADKYHRKYIPKPDEYCRFGVRHRTGALEEMNIDCRTITYFLFESSGETQPQVQSQTHVSTNIVNQTIVTTQKILPNGSSLNTQTPVNAINGVAFTQQILNGSDASVGNTQQINTVTTTTSQVLSVTDSRLSGKPVQINSEMKCYVTRITSYSNMQKPVPCGLLQEYAKSSFQRSSAATAKSSFQRSSAVIAKSSLTLIVMVVAILFY